MAKTFYVTLRQLVAPARESEKRLPARAARKLGCAEEDIVSWEPTRRSLDARRRRGEAVMVYHLRLELPNRLRQQLKKAKHLDLVFEAGGGHKTLSLIDPAPLPDSPRPLVVGAGPAGLFAALRLAEAGWKPLLIERGDDAGRRRAVCGDFWRHGVLDPESNPLFGEGGAGLFSDGKLNTRAKDREGMREILKAMVLAGAPESILVDAEPHVGSDLLGEVVANVGKMIRAFGGEILHRTRLDSLRVADGGLTEAVVSENGTARTIPVAACILAIGHSARDTYEMLHTSGFALEAKPFAVGLRVEMPQEAIDASQRVGKFKPGPGEAASFRLSRRPTETAASCYTFCMCPGGQVIACASEPGRLAVNGMSFHARAGEWGNAAFLSAVTPEDFAATPGDFPPALAGVAFQRFWEEKAFHAGATAGEYAVPASRLGDFIEKNLGELPEHRGVGRAVAADLRLLLPPRVGDSLAEAIPGMLARLRKVDLSSVILYGVETRTSSPVRISRDDDGQAKGVSGLYPAGEGSGYAGGIMTSALDGWKAAGNLMRNAR